MQAFSHQTKAATFSTLSPNAEGTIQQLADLLVLRLPVKLSRHTYTVYGEKINHFKFRSNFPVCNSTP